MVCYRRLTLMEREELSRMLAVGASLRATARWASTANRQAFLLSFSLSPQPSLKGVGRCSPQLRALRDHCFIVGPQRARRTLCLPPLPLLHLLLHPPYNDFFLG